MKPNFFENFRYKYLFEEAEITPVETQSNLEKILDKSPKITSVLIKLLTGENSKNDQALEQIRNTVSDIRCISYKPTTFRVVIPNGNYFDIKYMPTPLELDYPEDYSPTDAFQVLVSGKKFNIGNRSEYEEAMDYINILLKTAPITKEPEPEGEPAETAPEEETPPAEETPEEEA